MKKDWKKRLRTFVLAAAFAAYAAGTAYAAEDTTRFVSGTSINNVGVAGLTVEEAKSRIESYYNGSYTLKLTGENGKTGTIQDTDIAFSLHVTGDLSGILTMQNDGGRKSGPGEGNSYRVDVTSSYDETLLRKKLESLSIVTDASPTTDAHISAYEEGKNFTIVPEVQGDEINVDKLLDGVKAALDEQKSSVKLANLDCYKKIQVTSDSAELKRLCETMNQYKDVSITYTFGESSTTLTCEEIAKWVTGSEGTELQVSREQAAAYVKTLANTYDTCGKPHAFHTTAGRDITVDGAYGWQIDQEAETTALLELIRAGKNETREPVYARTAASHDTYDFGNTYVEVDMANQHLYYYENGTCVIDCPVVTGNVSKGYTTPSGLYTLNYKEKDRVLRGKLQADGTYEYESPVSYWMPFNGGIGLHDATWRNKFGGTIYKTNGSHGCVNLPKSAAKLIFEQIEAGDPVFCYHLDTRNPAVTAAKAAETTETEKAAQAAKPAKTQQTAAAAETPAAQTENGAATSDPTESAAASTEGTETSGTTAAVETTQAITAGGDEESFGPGFTEAAPETAAAETLPESAAAVPETEFGPGI